MPIKFEKWHLILISVCLLLSVFIIAISFWKTENKPVAVENPPSIAESCYLLKEYQGKIALYQPPFEVPEEVYDIYVDTLPSLDQERLSSGIQIDNPNELKDYLDDFDS